jgi:hypothetical protein
VVPEIVGSAIKSRLKDLENSPDVMTISELNAIKEENPTNSVLSLKNEVITKEQALSHIREQIGEDGLAFTEYGLNNRFLIGSTTLTGQDGLILGFKEGDNYAKSIDIANGHKNYSNDSWTISQNDLVVTFQDSRGTCTFSKLFEDSDFVDVNYVCEDSSGPGGLIGFVKPRPLSASDFVGKTLTLNFFDETDTLSFNSDYTCYNEENTTSDENSSCTYGDSQFHNTVRLISDRKRDTKRVRFVLAQGDMSDGLMLIQTFDLNASTNLDSISNLRIMKISGNTLTEVVSSIEADR